MLDLKDYELEDFYIDKKSRGLGWRRFQEHKKSRSSFLILKNRSASINNNKEQLNLALSEEVKRLKNNFTMCSCTMCGNPRRHFKELTLKEKSFKNVEATQDYLQTSLF